MSPPMLLCAADTMAAMTPLLASPVSSSFVSVSDLWPLSLSNAANGNAARSKSFTRLLKSREACFFGGEDA